MEHTGMATATDGLRRHQWSMTSPLARSLRRPPCCRPRLPGMNSSFGLPLPPLPSLLPQPPLPPRPAQSPNLAPTSFASFQLGPRIHDEEPRSVRAMRAGPLRTHARSGFVVCERLLQCILLLRACELLGSLPMFRLGLAHDTWSHAASLLPGPVCMLVCYVLPWMGTKLWGATRRYPARCLV